MQSSCSYSLYSWKLTGSHCLGARYVNMTGPCTDPHQKPSPRKTNQWEVWYPGQGKTWATAKWWTACKNVVFKSLMESNTFCSCCDDKITWGVRVGIKRVRASQECWTCTRDACRSFSLTLHSEYRWTGTKTGRWEDNEWKRWSKMVEFHCCQCSMWMRSREVSNSVAVMSLKERARGKSQMRSNQTGYLEKWNNLTWKSI